MNIRTTTFCCLAASCITLAQYAASASTLSDVQRQLFPDKAKVLQVNQNAIPLIESQNTTSNLNGVVILIGESGRPPVSKISLC